MFDAVKVSVEVCFSDATSVKQPCRKSTPLSSGWTNALEQSLDATVDEQELNVRPIRREEAFFSQDIVDMRHRRRDIAHLDSLRCNYRMLICKVRYVEQAQCRCVLSRLRLLS